MPATAQVNASAAPMLAQLRISGADARKFLQGQLSNNMQLLAADRMLGAGLHTPQGRVLAVLQMCTRGGDEIVALLPEDLAAIAAGALSRFILRAKVKISVEPADEALRTLPGAPAGTVAEKVVAIARGLPQVYAASSGQFIAQMLNLDVLGAISFDKGCYTGQEVIARAHYRGRVKRRMQRFAADGPLSLPPGAALRLRDGRSALLVDSVNLPTGGCEFLAVTTVPGPHAGDEPASASLNEAPLIASTPLPLPYPLP
jgi:folate-binding protein YgfZ